MKWHICALSSFLFQTELLYNVLTQQQVSEGKVLLINKPIEFTSFAVISRLRGIFRVKKIGHAGTLDPLATGLLIICTGKFTKRINEFMGMDKTYTGTITLGATTPTYDLESEPVDFKPYVHLSMEDFKAAALTFSGPILQVPPAHSAIKVGGKRVYELARRGEAVELKARPVTIHSFTITGVELPQVHFEVRCTTGTYIRTLAHDFGAALGCGGYLSALCRTAIGDFKLHDAESLEDIRNRFDSTSIENRKA